MNPLNPAGIAFAHRVRYQDAMLRAWARRTGRMNRNGALSYRPEELPAYIDPPTNAQRSHVESLEFAAGAVRGSESYAAYLTHDADRGYRITTFVGDTLALVTSIASRKDSQSWVTDTRGSFWAVGIDGRHYYGRHNGVGLWCRMRLGKHQPKGVQP